MVKIKKATIGCAVKKDGEQEVVKMNGINRGQINTLLPTGGLELMVFKGYGYRFFKKPCFLNPMSHTYDSVSSARFCIEERAIEPVKVIEGFGLYHHLACAAKYISRAERKTSAFNSLGKAECCLEEGYP